MHLVFLCTNAYRAVVVERYDSFREKTDGLEEVVDAYGHEYVKLEVAL